MADFSIGSLLKKLPSAQSVVGTAKNVAGKAAEGLGNMAFPGAGTGTSLALQYPKSVPVRGLVQGGATGAGLAAQLGGFATTSVGVGVGLGAAGMGLSAAAPSLGNEAQYRWNQLTGGKQNPTYFGPAYGNVNVPSGGPRNFGPDYKNRELAAGQSAENYRTGAGFPGQSPAAERAYQGEVFRTAQLAAQSPEMLAWAAQREKDLKSKDYSKSEDMGMRIWAQKYGPGSKNDLASKVKPGQAGYDVIQEVIKGKAAPSAAATPATTAYNPFAVNAYSSNFKLPGMEEYANSMQGAIVRSPGIMPSYAMDNPMLGDYNSTVNQGYNLSFPIVPTTTVNTNSAAMGAALYTPNSSVQAMGNFAGPPIKLPIGNTPFGTTGYQAFTAGALLPNITKEQIFGPKAEGKFNAMFSANR
jgi:hypothetical protein